MAELKHPHSEVPADLGERRREIVKREVKLHWQKLSDVKLLKISAVRDACLSLLHEKYGYTQKQVGDELDHVLSSFSTRHGNKITQRKHQAFKE